MGKRPEKSETIAVLGQDPVKCKIVVDNKCSQQLKNFKYLGCTISYENEKDIQQTSTKFPQIVGIRNNTFKPTLVQKFSRMKVHNTLALPILIYESETWTLRIRSVKTHQFIVNM
jgi:hypothetical protein